MVIKKKETIKLAVLAALLAVSVYLYSGIYRSFKDFSSGSSKFVANKKGRQAISEEVFLKRLSSPPEYRLSIFAKDIPNARFMRITGNSNILVSSPGSGRIMILEKDRNGDSISDSVKTLLSGLNKPHGIDIWDGYLYVAETDSVGRIRFDEMNDSVSGSYERIITGLPTGGHWTRTLRFGPDGFMYLSIGSSCNVCVEKDQRRAAIIRYRPDGSGEEVFATGLRNSVGFDWSPADGKIYATDNGRDLLGDDFPPCELNRIEKGGFYGWPFANGDRITDPDLGKGHEDLIASSIKPVHGFRAHNAPLGICFLKSGAAPSKYRGSALVALHGSWNRSRKDGYKVVYLSWNKDGSIEERDFLTGFLSHEDENVIGRPVDVAEDRDGNIYVSDDLSVQIYLLKPISDHSPNKLIGAAELWKSHSCGSCHDSSERIEGMITKELSGLSANYSANDLFQFLKTPTPPMPQSSMNDEELKTMAEFLLARYP